MANIVRCKLPNGVHRFSPFTIKDYRDFLLVRNDLLKKSPEEQKQLIDELLEDYFSDYPVAWRPFIFIKVYSSSIGKTKIPVQWTCPKCGSTKQSLLNLEIEELKNPSIETAGVKINFKFPDKSSGDMATDINDNIWSVEQNGLEYLWSDMTDEIKNSVIDAIDNDSFTKIVKMMSSIYIEVELKCCEYHKIAYDNILDIFKLLMNPDEVFTFYQSNHILIKHSYDLNSIMSMIPIERTIALSLIEKDKK